MEGEGERKRERERERERESGKKKLAFFFPRSIVRGKKNLNESFSF